MTRRNCFLYFVPFLICSCRIVFGQLPQGLEDTQLGNAQPPSPGESLSLVSVPPGFRVSLFAGEPQVAQPIAINYDDRGRLWVLESFSYIEWKRAGKDRILIFEDTDNDGRFDSRKVFWDRGNHTSGFQIGYGGVWLCDAPQLLFIPDRDGDDVPDGEPQVILDGWTTEAEHNFFNGLVWGPDGWLYGRHGIKKPSKVGKPGTPDRERTALSCCIWRYHPHGQRFEVWADGTVNPWGLDWNEEGEGFINTSVIDHLWHLVPGARYRRMSAQDTGPAERSSYALMEPTSDHRHWSGGETGRKDFASNDEAGGGHSHCGMVIYQSEAWPEEYRGRAFFSNVLGQRINMDHLLPKGPAWVASHGADFLQSSSPWFRAVDLRQGPFGEMMIAEWTDLGECHDRDGIHRSSGRLYEVWYGSRPKKHEFDLSAMGIENLLDLMFHENVWWRRHARRNIQERMWNGESLTGEQVSRITQRARNSSIRNGISAIQILHASGIDPENWYPQLYQYYLNSASAEKLAALRIHLLTLVFTEATPTSSMVKWFEQSIAQETSTRVHYRMAALLQRIPLQQRWKSAELLAEIPVPDQDRNFSLMRWYGIEPLVALDVERAMKMALATSDPWLSESISRRAVDAGGLSRVIQSLLSGERKGTSILRPVLGGILKALPSEHVQPAGWGDFYSEYNDHNDSALRKLVFELALRFGNSEAEDELLQALNDVTIAKTERKIFLEMLVSAGASRLAQVLPQLIEDPVLGESAIRAMAAFPSEGAAEKLIDLYLQSSEQKRKTVILETLASRKNFSDNLVDAVLDEKISAEFIPTYIARQIASIASRKSKWMAEFGIDRQDLAARAKKLAVWKKRLPESYLAAADPVEGREVFRRVCAACHKMYGTGGEIGPDLTGSGRADLDYFLINVLFPSEDVMPEYRLVTLQLRDGRTLVGNIVAETDTVLTLRQIGKSERIDVAQIVNREVSETSLMPPGLIDHLKREDVRDLVGYLRTKKALD